MLWLCQLGQVSLESREHPSAPMVLRLFGGKGVAFLSALLLGYIYI